MADNTQGPGNGLIYVLLGALCVVVAGGGYYVYRNKQDLPAVSQALPPVVPAPEQAAPTGHSASQIDAARSAIAEAQRKAARGDFAGAERTLQDADRIAPGFAETAATRREIAELRTTRGDPRRNRTEPRRDATNIATLVDAARAAIARRDYDAADHALDEAEKIDAQDPAVVRTRNEFLEAAARPGPRDQPR